MNLEYRFVVSQDFAIFFYFRLFDKANYILRRVWPALETRLGLQYSGGMVVTVCLGKQKFIEAQPMVINLIIDCGL
jgi:hypothetical protein